MSADGSHNGETPVGVLIVDDKSFFRQVAREVVEAAAPDFVVLGEAASGEEALAALAGGLHPDLVVADIRMTGMDGIEMARRVRAAHPEVVVVLVTTEESLNLPAEVGSCGAADVARKQDFRPSLLRRLWRTHGARRRAATDP